MTDPYALHAGLLTIDTHIDIPWPNGPSFFEEGKRRVDLPKMRRGGLAAGCFAAYVPQGPRTPEGHEAAYTRAIAMLQAIQGNGARGRPGCAVSADEIERARRDDVTAIVPCVENGHACAGRSGTPAPLPRSRRALSDAHA